MIDNGNLDGDIVRINRKLKGSHLRCQKEHGIIRVKWYGVKDVGVIAPQYTSSCTKDGWVVTYNGNLELTIQTGYPLAAFPVTLRPDTIASYLKLTPREVFKS